MARLLEAFVHYLIDGGVVGGGAFVNQSAGQFQLEPLYRDPNVDFRALPRLHHGERINDLMGDGELFKIIFTRRSSELKSTRRARIRSLVRLSRLTDAHPIDVLRDPKTAPHAELVAILTELGAEGASGLRSVRYERVPCFALESLLVAQRGRTCRCLR